ncbi:hypothetical protein M430DRAFT_174621 [Amorphotheca resinae ATCC 22711]|uniref:SprT-like domain-containing protein n=1 Tax=Amorphotheca resinae ATCC 22711 TaxID=857342 RepID=A0A2T3AVP9_AMORE|nr:hypothetical protein M430DRAFT_174621 [Amorphotheca resinae ATCC 22711]PSS12738.1 hypothetical protein M430DRAFT_174621 [Amorphotheca resinae ATCC 22711]
MAAPPRGGSNPESFRSISRPRYSHDRKTIDSGRRRDSYSRRQHVEWPRDHSARRSPPRQRQRSPQQQLPATMTTPDTSIPSSLNGSIEYTASFRMERTPSGNSIISDDAFEPRHSDTFTAYSDEEAARRVEIHFKHLLPHGKHERILRNLIESPFPIDEKALDSLLTAADWVFFCGVLSGRVRWEWSHPSQERYRTELIGTTAFRPAAQGGYETLIVLSDPILNHPDYDRRLLLSTFLHELVHCYLFIQCGFVAKLQGGHTDGFLTIASIIDKWAGNGYLRLCNMKANLDHFRSDRARIADAKNERPRDHSRDACNHSPGPHTSYFECGCKSRLGLTVFPDFC